MDLETTREGAVATVAVSGIVDMRASSELEAALTAALSDGARHLIVDFKGVELLTSAGIRVLVTITRRVGGNGGRVVLCALSEGVRRVFDISGLTRQFNLAATRAEAAASIPSTAAGSPPRRSRLAVLAASVLGGGTAAPGRRPGAAAPSRLASEIARLLGDAAAGPRT